VSHVEYVVLDEGSAEENEAPHLEGRTFGCGCCSTTVVFESAEAAMSHLQAMEQRHLRAIAAIGEMMTQVKANPALKWGTEIGSIWDSEALPTLETKDG
jgi:hypothetical protein